jgi:hypothetical protein
MMIKIYLACFLCIVQMSNAQTKRKTAKSSVAVIQTQPSPIITTTTTVVTPNSPTPRSSVVNAQKTYSTDLIIKTDGTTIDAKIIEITPTEVVFKKFNNLNGPIFRLSRNEIKSIRYANGEVDNNIQTVQPINSRRVGGAVVSSNPNDVNQSTKASSGGYNKKRFGILGGINSYKLNFSNNTSSVKTSSSTGFNLGFIGDFPLSNDFSLRVSPYASFKNTIMPSGKTLSTTSISGVVNGLYHIPISQGNFVLGGGLALDYFLSANNGGTTWDIGNNPVNDDLLPLDYGINITGGYDARTWSASVYYTFGLANLEPKFGNGSSLTFNSSTVGLQLNYWFGN